MTALQHPRYARSETGNVFKLIALATDGRCEVQRISNGTDSPLWDDGTFYIWRIEAFNAMPIAWFRAVLDDGTRTGRYDSPESARQAARVFHTDSIVAYVIAE